MTLDDRFHPEALLEHAGWMRSFARRLVREDEEDLVQESWLAALKRGPLGLRDGGSVAQTQGQSRGQQLGPWLASVTRNLASNRRRGDAARSAREEDHGAVERTVPTPAELVERSEAHRGVVDAVLALNEPLRATLLLRYFEGLSAPEIAARTNVPQGTVRTRLHRGIAKLREELDDSHGGDRKRWVMALTPLAGFPGPIAAAPAAVSAFPVLAMTSFKLLALAVPLIALFAWLRSGESSTEGAAQTPVANTTTAAKSTQTHPRLQRPIGTDGATAERTALRRVAAMIGTSRLADPEAPAGTPEPRLIQLVDERTGEPAWDYVIETVPARGKGSPTRISSDRLGNLTIPAGVVALAPIDRMLDGRNVPRPYGGGPGRPDDLAVPEVGEALSVPFGRTAFMAIEAPAEVELAGAFAELRVENAPWDRLLASAPLRHFEGRTYARFQEYAAKDLTGSSIRVLTANGMAGASVEAPPYVGTGSTAPIVFGAMAALTVELMAPNDVELEGAFLTLSVASEAGTPSTARRRVPHHEAKMVDGIARFRYLGLSPGKYDLEARAGGLRSQVSQVTLAASIHETRHLHLKPDPAMIPVGAVDITFTSATGTFHRPLWVKTVQYGPNSSPVHSDRSDIAWTESKGIWSGAARVDGLSGGTHYLEFPDAHADRGPTPMAYLIDPSDFEVRPGETKEIAIHDDRQFEHRTVRAIDAETLEPIEFIDVQYWRAGAEAEVGHIQGMSFEARLPFIQSPAELKLQISSDDHLPLELPEGSLEAGDLTVKLKRGWACYFAAMDEANQSVEGIEVIVDGTSAGTTSNTSIFVVTRDRCPDHVTFRAPGWKVVAAPFLSPKGQIVAGSRASGRAHIITVVPE